MRRSLLVLLFALAGCQLPTRFTTQVQGEATIAGSPLGSLLGVFPAVANFTDVDFNQNQDFRNQGATKEQVTSVQLDAITLQLLSPGDQDFSFLDSIRFTAKAGADKALIAERTGIRALPLPPPNPELRLDLRTRELRPFVTAPSMSIEVEGSGRQPPKDVRLQATVELTVEVKVL